MIINKIIEVSGQRWKIEEAVDMEAAKDAIASARCSGSVGWKDTRTTFPNGIDKPGETIVAAVVIRVHSDGTEVQPYETVRQ